MEDLGAAGAEDFDDEDDWTLLLVNAIASAFFAGSVAIAITIAIERLGGTLGGVLGTLPSTIVPASIGFAIQAGSDLDSLWQTMCLTPVNMTLSTGFLYMWKIVPPYLPPSLSLYSLILVMLLIALSVWAVAAIIYYYAINALLDHGLPVHVLGIGAVIFMFVSGVLAACIQVVPAPKGSQSVSFAMYCARGLLAATAIGIGVFVSIWSEFLASLAAVFPAIFMTSMVALWISQGRAVPAGAIGPMMLGATSVASYSIIFVVIYWLAYEPWGQIRALLAATIGGFIIASMGISTPIYFGLRWRRSCVEAEVDVEDELNEMTPLVVSNKKV